MMQVKGFPIRLLGFGLYWAWLFLVEISPSPIAGTIAYTGVPFELLALGARLAFLLVIVVAAKRIETPIGQWLLLAFCAIGGPAATVLAFTATSGALIMVAAVAVAAVDAAMFMLWLCFFGSMRVGVAALYISLSYAIGGIICVLFGQLDGVLATGVTAILPLLSGLAFVLSAKMSGDARLAERQPDSPTHEDRPVTDDETIFPYVLRMNVALCAYAVLYGLVAGFCFTGEIDAAASGPFVEAPCAMILGLLLAVCFSDSQYSNKMYLIYKLVPVLFTIGIVFMLFGDVRSKTTAVVCVNLAYLAFEVMAFNDICNTVKERGLSLTRSIGLTRIASTLGMALGWAVATYFALFPSDAAPSIVVTAVSVVLIVVMSTIVFTEKEHFVVLGLADDQRHRESPQPLPDAESDSVSHAADSTAMDEHFDRRAEAFAESYRLSTRETEVLKLLLKGRNVQYVSDHLFIAPGTVKTHTYNLYRKLDVHTKMELLDAFDLFIMETNRTTNAKRN